MLLRQRIEGLSAHVSAVEVCKATIRSDDAKFKSLQRIRKLTGTNLEQIICVSSLLDPPSDQIHLPTPSLPSRLVGVVAVRECLDYCNYFDISFDFSSFAQLGCSKMSPKSF